MRLVYTDRLIGRLSQLANEVLASTITDCHDRLRAFKSYCEETPGVASLLSCLPTASLDMQGVDWFHMERDGNWGEGTEGYAQRWYAIKWMVTESRGVEKTRDRIATCFGTRRNTAPPPHIARLFVVPLYNYLAHQLEGAGETVHILLRYKRWAEWFEAERLREIYTLSGERGGETGLDRDLRRFLFESGIDYPFSQPRSPGGQADIVAQLDTDDPLVLEVKVWDSSKGYGENRVRDGLRQAMQYADSYGKDSGYVVVYNLDREPLAFISLVSTEEWPPRLEVGGQTFYFIDVHIAEQTEPVSQRGRGQRVATHRIRLADLLSEANTGKGDA